MKRKSRSARPVRIGLIAGFLCHAAPGLAQEGPSAAKKALDAAVQLFDEGDYAGAQHGLNQIDVAALSEADRSRHGEHLQRAALAVSMFEKAETDYLAAKKAAADGRLEDARRLYQLVADNQYADKQTRTESRERLQALQPPKPTPPATPPPAPAPTSVSPPASGAAVAKTVNESDPDISRQLRSLRAKVLTREANEAMSAGRLSEAERLFKQALDTVPGHPEAVQGLQQLGKHEGVESDAQSLIGRIRERGTVAWQRTVATYRTAEREVRDQVMANQYDLAKQTLLRARQVVESGKVFAEPVSEYESLAAEVEALGRYVEDEERRYNDEQTSLQRDEARRANTERKSRAEDAKRAKITALMTEAMQRKNEGDYDAAIHVLEQVLAVDPRYDNARWTKETLEDQRAFAKQLEDHKEFSRQQQGVLMDVEETKTPWWQELNYPKNWLEIISRKSRQPPGSEGQGIDTDLQSRLDKPIRTDFQNEPFGKVIEALAEANGTNVSVAWNDLAAASVTAATPVTLKLSQPVPLRVALREVLDQVGGARVDLGYLPVDGVVKIASKGLLDREVYQEVYDVHDLLMPIPDFADAPRMDLQDPGSFVGYGSSFSGQGYDRPVFAPRNSEEQEIPEEVIQQHASQLATLIRSTIDPESWRENNGSVGSIHEINGQLVITQTPGGHARVGGLLSRLREQRAIQVALEARFITVQSNYLEEMGIDLDVILNSGNAGFDFIPGTGGTTVVDPVLGSRLLLPRSFSRLGFTPGTPAVGTALGGGAITQPFTQPGLVPAAGNNFVGGQNITPFPIVNNTLNLTDPRQLVSDLPGSYAGNPTLQPALNVFGSFLDNIQVDFLIRATQADSRTSLLTAPRLVLFNGQRAWVAVVNQQSFVSSLQPVVDAQGQAPLINTIETGAVLDAQATVSADKRYVTMTLRPSVGRLLDIQTFAFSVGAGAGQGSFVQLPSITRTVVRTTVSVPDGGTLLIGGQKLAGEIEVEAGVPILSKIPILKRLYENKTLVKDEQVLLILIKPKIIIQSEAEQEAFPTFQGQ